MPTIEQNLKWWGKPAGWADGGERWSAPWGGTDVEWWATLYPRVRQFLPAATILEIAPGFGRWAQFLKGFCDKFIAVDLSPACIDNLKEQFAADSHVHCYVNDGKSLAMVDDKSIDFAFTFDSLPHVEADVIAAYLHELRKKLKPNGFAFIHHSNLEAYRKSLWLPKAIVPPETAANSNGAATPRGYVDASKPEDNADQLGRRREQLRQSGGIRERQNFHRAMRCGGSRVQVAGTDQLEFRAVADGLSLGGNSAREEFTEAAPAAQESPLHGRSGAGAAHCGVLLRNSARLNQRH